MGMTAGMIAHQNRASRLERQLQRREPRPNTTESPFSGRRNEQVESAWKPLYTGILQDRDSGPLAKIGFSHVSIEISPA
jgi:hypothetical protein